MRNRAEDTKPRAAKTGAAAIYLPNDLEVLEAPYVFCLVNFENLEVVEKPNAHPVDGEAENVPERETDRAASGLDDGMKRVTE